MKRLRLRLGIACLFVATAMVGCQDTQSSIGLQPVDNPIPRGRFLAMHIDAGSILVKPKAVYQVLPAYPLVLREHRISGHVLLVFVVKPDGYVTDVEVVKATDVRFGENAARALSRWRFSPGSVNGVLVATRMLMPLDFAIH